MFIPNIYLACLFCIYLITFMPINAHTIINANLELVWLLST